MDSEAQIRIHERLARLEAQQAQTVADRAEQKERMEEVQTTLSTLVTRFDKYEARFGVFLMIGGAIVAAIKIFLWEKIKKLAGG